MQTELMQRIAPARETVARIDTLIAQLDNPLHKEMLAAFRKHWWSEVLGDVETALAVMPEDIIFKGVGLVLSGQPFELHTKTEQRALYQGQLDAGLPPGAGTFHSERWAFADWGLTLEAVWVFVLYGSMIGGLGSFDPKQLYLVEVPCVAVMPYCGNGILGGEIFYFGNHTALEPTDKATLDWLIQPELSSAPSQ